MFDIEYIQIVFVTTIEIGDQMQYTSSYESERYKKS